MDSGNLWSDLAHTKRSSNHSGIPPLEGQEVWRNHGFCSLADRTGSVRHNSTVPGAVGGWHLWNCSINRSDDTGGSRLDQSQVELFIQAGQTAEDLQSRFLPM